MVKNLKFTMDMENKLMGEILDKNADPKAAGVAWLKANPAAIGPWLAGVKTFDGSSEALAAVKKGLGL